MKSDETVKIIKSQSVRRVVTLHFFALIILSKFLT